MLIISDNEKYDIELKELANMLFARRKKIYLKNEIDADNETEIISLKKKMMKSQPHCHKRR